MKKNNLWLLFLLTTSIIFFTGCSEKSDSKSLLNYQQPIATMISAIKNNDTQSYLNCFTSVARDNYKKSEKYNSRLTEVLLPKQGNRSVALKQTILKATELDSEALNALENDYKDSYKLRIDILKAYKLSVEIGTIQSENIISQIREITVVNTKNGWLIYDPVIDEFDFTK